MKRLRLLGGSRNNEIHDASRDVLTYVFDKEIKFEIATLSAGGEMIFETERYIRTKWITQEGVKKEYLIYELVDASELYRLIGRSRVRIHWYQSFRRQLRKILNQD